MQREDKRACPYPVASWPQVALGLEQRHKRGPWGAPGDPLPGGAFDHSPSRGLRVGGRRGRNKDAREQLLPSVLTAAGALRARARLRLWCQALPYDSVTTVCPADATRDFAGAGPGCAALLSAGCSPLLST